MITFGGFILGLALFLIGLFMLWRSDAWRQNVGSLNTILQSDKEWLDWNFIGIILMLAGVIIAFGLFQTFIALTVGRLIN